MHFIDRSEGTGVRYGRVKDLSCTAINLARLSRLLYLPLLQQVDSQLLPRAINIST